MELLERIKWIEIINVLINEDCFTIIIKDGCLVGMKYFDIDFTNGVNLEEKTELQSLCVNILDYSDTLKYTDHSLAQIIRDCTNVILDNQSESSGV